jgi:hypothetical protein
MARRWLSIVLWSGIAAAQVPPPDDPLWQYPALVGPSAPVKPDCDYQVLVPGPKFCLQPAGRPRLWLRGDEITQSGSLKEWGRYATQPDLFLRPRAVPNGLAGFPVVKFSEYTELSMGAAPALADRRFTIFVVGRKTPGTEYMGILGHESDPEYGALYWAGSNGLVLNVQSASPLSWQYKAVEEFHLVALRCDFATVAAFVNGEPIDVRTLSADRPGYPANRGVVFTHVGRYGGAPPATPQERMNARRGPLRGGDLAEVLYYARTLTDDELAGTTQYLIRKYSLPIPGRAVEVEQKPATPAQVVAFPADDDAAEQALAGTPVMLGFNSPTAKQCDYKATPGQPNYCLRPADGVHAWLRGDDVWTRTTILKLWKSPPFIGNEATGADNPGANAWLLPNALATFPAARVADGASLRFKTPLRAPEFTAFIVGRQTPGSFSGQILSSDPASDQGISWHDGKTLRVRGGADAVVDFEDPAATEFHLVALQYRDGALVAYTGAQPGIVRDVALPSGMRFDFIGTPSRSTAPAGSARALFGGGIQMRAPERPSQGADIAEVLLWPRALDAAEMTATRRYLRRKYALP